MNHHQKFLNNLSWNYLGTLLIIVLVFTGITLRLVNLEQKVYSADEVRGIMRFSGYTTQEVKNRAFIGEIISVQDLQKFQRPNSERSLNEVLEALAGNPEHPPLYPLMARFWMQLFPGVNSARIFSIVISILVIPCLYWLCVELFDSPLTGWVAITLFTVSPFHILAAQNTTQYSLWTVMILLSGATLLKALREKTKGSWLLYTITLALAFYTHLFSATVAIAQGIYVILVERFKFTKTFLTYCLASIGSILLFTPWISTILNNLSKIDKNTQYYSQFKTNIFAISQTLFRHLGHIFIDFFHKKGKTENFLHILIFFVVVYSLYYLIRLTSPRIWLFIITLIVIPLLFQVVPDLLSSSIRSLQARYYLPVFLGVQISVSYLIANHIKSQSRKNWLNYFSQQIFLLLLLLGVLSGLLLAQTRDAGLDDQRGTASGTNLTIAEALNRMKKPLVISDTTPSFVLALSYLVNDNVKFQLFQDQDVPRWQEKLDLNQVKSQYSNIVILYPDEKFLAFLTSQHFLETKEVVKGMLEIKTINFKDN